jgi:aminoglycoside phosphotransferase (APT) family kinase protein
VKAAEHDLRTVVSQFRIPGIFAGARPHGNGHINDSYRVSFEDAGAIKSYLLQRLNTKIFTHPELVMENVQRVTSHIAMKLAGEGKSLDRALTLIPTQDGQGWLQQADGSVWRVFRFIEAAQTYDSVESAEQAYQVGKAFGDFQLQLADMPLPRLHETIPGFHDTPKRVLKLQRAIELDVANRAAGAAAEINFALARLSLASVLQNAKLPERITHNDTKLNNVLMDVSSGEAVCVVDLDTVMPGLALYDFGDMVRTATCPTAEDEQDLSLVYLRISLFEALVRGYLSSAGGLLTQAEKDYLAFSGKLIAFEQAIRFLTDYLEGDHYYKVSRVAQNLDRCRTQMKLVESIEEQEDEMRRMVNLMSV